VKGLSHIPRIQDRTSVVGLTISQSAIPPVFAIWYIFSAKLLLAEILWQVAQSLIFEDKK
jgi:hypothetical protein